MTDQGNEYWGIFDKGCAEHGVHHTRTKPRHAWTNGSVERLRDTILPGRAPGLVSELWRIEIRRRFFPGRAPGLVTSATAMQMALDRYLDFYNHRRSHQGYRTQGRTPGEIFFSHGGKRDKRQRLQSVNTYPV